MQLKPGSTVTGAIASLDELVRTAGNIRGAKSPVDRLNDYRQWSTHQVGVLSRIFSAATVDSLLSTRRHWILQSLDPIAYGPAVGELVDLELAECVESAANAIDQLRSELARWQRWGYDPAHGLGSPAVVLDTNVLMTNLTDLTSIDWHRGLAVFPDHAVGLGIPMTVVEELDRLKLATGDMQIGGRKVARRTLARRALNWLDDAFAGDSLVSHIRHKSSNENRLESDLFAVLMADDLRHERLNRPDLEIIDQACQLRPFVTVVAIATHDHAMRFRSRSIGLRSFEPAPLAGI